MPRPKSEITKVNLQVAVRVTKPMQQEFKRLGGAKWLRKLLAQSLENLAREKAAQQR